MSDSTPTPTHPVKRTETKYVYRLPNDANFVDDFDLWWNENRASFKGFFRWSTAGGWGFRFRIASPSLWVRLGPYTLITLVQVVTEKRLVEDEVTTNGPWVTANENAVKATEKLCTAIQTWIEETYQVGMERKRTPEEKSLRKRKHSLDYKRQTVGEWLTRQGTISQEDFCNQRGIDTRTLRRWVDDIGHNRT